MIDKIAEQAKQELQEEAFKDAKAKLKSVLKRRATAQQVLANIDIEYNTLLEQLKHEMVE